MRMSGRERERLQQQVMSACHIYIQVSTTGDGCVSYTHIGFNVG